MTIKPVLFIRSLLFAILFYTLTLVHVLAAIAAMTFSEPLARKIVRSWGQMHRLLCRWVLGQRIRIIGTIPEEAALYIFKH